MLKKFSFKKLLSVVAVILSIYAVAYVSINYFGEKYRTSEMNQKFTDYRDTEESELYNSLINDLGDDYFIENISTSYVSQEYIEDLEFNSKENIYFGYTSSELDEEFQGKKYVFTYDGNKNSTQVKAFEKYDDTYERVLKNVAIGSGVILTCITVSSVLAPSAPAISLILLTSAKAGAISALSDGVISGIGAGIVEAVNSKDPNRALKKAVLEGSEGFKWGAIAGSLVGGIGEATTLKAGTLKGLTMNEAATIQRESKYPIEIIKNISSMKEFGLYKEANLVPTKIGNKIALVQNVDLNSKSKLGGKVVTNLERMKRGYAPVNKAGEPYELHHIGQSVKSPLAILTKEQHRLGKNNKTLHDPNISDGVHSKLSKSQWNKQRKAFWKSMAKFLQGDQNE